METYVEFFKKDNKSEYLKLFLMTQEQKFTCVSCLEYVEHYIKNVTFIIYYMTFSKNISFDIVVSYNL